MTARYGELPPGYADLVRDATNIELDFEGRYLRIWDPATCIDQDEGYEISTRMPGAVPFGDDGVGRSAAVLYRSGRGRNIPCRLRGSGSGRCRLGRGRFGWIASSGEGVMTSL